MKNIEKVLNEYNPEDINLKEEYYKLLKDESFKKIVDSLDIDTLDLINNQSSLNTANNLLKECRNCKGLVNCKSDMLGHVYYPTIINKALYFSYLPCKYKKKLNKEEGYKSNISLYDMPKGLGDASISTIWTKDKNRIPVIKEITNFIDLYKAKKPCKGIYLHGSFGSGKTYLISALLNKLASDNIKVAAVYFPEFLRSLKASFEEGGYNTKFNHILNIPILLLDDIGAETTSVWSRDEILGSILQHRMVNNLPTFFTSNFSIAELEQHLSLTKAGTDEIKSRRIIERVKFMTTEISLVSINNREVNK